MAGSRIYVLLLLVFNKALHFKVRDFSFLLYLQEERYNLTNSNKALQAEDSKL